MGLYLENSPCGRHTCPRKASVDATGWPPLEIATAQRNALLQRDDALVTRWWSSELKLPTLLALVEFYFGVGNASRSFFHVANALTLEKQDFSV